MSKSDTRQKCFNDGKEYAVAVYMRIANGDTAQVSSFEMQKEVYKDYISRQKNWRFVDIYSDEYTPYGQNPKSP